MTFLSARRGCGQDWARALQARQGTGRTAVDERVRDRGEGGVVERERDGGDRLDAGEELLDEGRLLNVEHLGLKDLSVVVDLRNLHAVRERRDAEHVEQGRLGRSDTGAGDDEVDVRDNLDRSTRNLGRDIERLEERRLSGLHARVASRDVDVVGRVRSSLGGRGDLVGEDDVADLLEVRRGEDESNVATDVGEETLERRVLGEDHADGTTDPVGFDNGQLLIPPVHGSETNMVFFPMRICPLPRSA